MKNNCPPIIGITANVFKEDVEKYFEAGMTDVLAKPVRKSKIAKAISLIKKGLIAA